MPTIDLLGSAYEHKRNARRRLEAEARADVTRKLESISNEFDQMVLRAKNEGAKMTHIAREMQTSTTVVYQCLKRAQAFSNDIPAFDPLGLRYSVEGDQIRVTLTPDEIRDTFANFGQQDHPEAPNSALFAKMGQAWVFQGENWLGKYEHPVSLWWSDTAHRTEMERWAVENLGVGVEE